MPQRDGTHALMLMLITAIAIGAAVAPVWSQTSSSRGEGPGRPGGPAIEIKIASVAPSNTPYSTALEQLASDWERISGGRLHVRVYENGVAGNQADMLRKMRIGQLQGGLFASTGLTAIAPGALSVSVPYLVQTDDELAAVMKRLRPRLDDETRAHGYESVVWAEAGWVYLFATQPVMTPTEAQSLKFAIPSDEEALLQTFRTLGYRTVSIDLPETLSALNSGLVNAVFATPSLAAGYQWFGIARYMINVPIAPALGAVIISEQTWNRIPQSLRPQLQDAAHRAETALHDGLEAVDSQAVDIMQKYGLKLVPVPDSDQELWKREMNRHLSELVGPVFDSATVSLVQEAVAAYRSSRQ